MLPAVKINGLGYLSLPVSESDAPHLSSVFIQAPFGQGEQTVVNTDVRDTLQLGPEHFSIDNPEWADQMASIVNEVQSKLGCSQATVVARLYKLLLYKPGGHFKPHQDTEKEPGMFGTLVVQLPSDYDGGESIIQHDGRKLTFGFNAAVGSVYKSFYTSWYADCVHEIKPDTRGYRVCLVYNLCAQGLTANLSAH